MTHDDHLHLTRRERQIMDVLYLHGEASARVIHQSIPDAPSYSAVRALLQKLLDKGHVRFRREGAKYLYEPIVAAEDARASAWHRLLSTFFGDSPRDAFVHLLGREGDNLDAADLETLSTLVDELKARREGND